MWTAIFKKIGLYNPSYHEKYRDYIHEKRYGKFIDLVANDIQEKIKSINKDQAKECLKEFFQKKEFVCPDIPK